MSEDEAPKGNGETKAGNSLALRLGIAGALGLGALATGFILTRPGRKLLADVMAGRTRTHVESRVLDELWSDRLLGRRRIEVHEAAPGHVVLLGRVASAEEIGRAVALSERVQGVQEVDSELEVDPAASEGPFRRRRDAAD